MRVEIWSDVVCPWCYIGKRRLETALANVSHLPGASNIEVVFKPYQLDPTASPGKVQPVTEAYATKYPSKRQRTQRLIAGNHAAADDEVITR